MKKIYHLIPLSLIIACFSGCTPTIDSRGYNPETLDLNKIQLGVDTKETIQEKFGSPSTTSTFPDSNQRQSWYYVSKKTSTTSFHTPQTLEQQTIVIAFDPKDIVREVKKIDGENTNIEPNQKKTETTGYESNVLRDVFGNFGKYSTRDPNAKK
ncbi:MAG: outer membrane protein assembly factor BamE [Alphaproteobacteria bacterium]|nr:outer membrane protein assembly factor BamE [Alphaproteobacteria bacterium]